MSVCGGVQTISKHGICYRTIESEHTIACNCDVLCTRCLAGVIKQRNKKKHTQLETFHIGCYFVVFFFPLSAVTYVQRDEEKRF